MSSVTEQIITLISTSALECPICMDAIEGVCNRVVTECGHAFHCSCLMQNTAHNGFGCPYCRTKMADEPEEEDDEEEESEDEVTIFDEDVLTSFRMFHQRINGEEVEEESEEWETDDEEEQDAEEAVDEATSAMPDASYVAQKLAARGITMEDLVKNILFQEHSSWGDFDDYERRSSEVYGQFRAIISQYNPQDTTPVISTNALALEPTPTPQPVVAPISSSETIPVIAESKIVAIPRRREFMCHV